MKRVWKGAEGAYKKADLVSWFRVYNSTGIQQVDGYFTKAKKDYAKHAMLDKNFDQVKSNNKYVKNDADLDDELE